MAAFWACRVWSAFLKVFLASLQFGSLREPNMRLIRLIFKIEFFKPLDFGDSSSGIPPALT